MEITLDKATIDALVAQIKEIDGKLESAKGTASERRQAAEKALRETEATQIEEAGGLTDNLEEADAVPFHVADELAHRIAELTDRLADVKNSCKEAVDGYLRQQKDETSAEVEALKTQRATLATKVTALATLLEVDVDVPKAPKSSTNGSGTPRAKTSKGTFSYRRDGSDEWTVPNEHQQSLSSIAYRVFDKVPTPQLRAALEESGVTEFTKSWEATVTVNGKTATVKFDVSE